MTKSPVFNRVVAGYKLSGVFGDFLDHVTDHWLKLAPAGNPAMLEMFRDRDREPARNLVPWAGEFVGKYITGAVQCLRLNDDKELRKLVRQVVAELLPLQATDGYLGPWPTPWRLTNRRSASPQGLTWDTWGHYHIMLGLLLWHEDTDEPQALLAARRMADAICKLYLGNKQPRLADTGSTEMNLAPAHSLVLLYRKTHVKRYLDMAEQIVAEFAARGPDGAFLSGNYLEGTLAGQPFYHLPKPRWESLHPIMALAELYYATGKTRYREAFEKLWASMCTGDRHNNGGWSAGEQAQGNPYHLGAIETCCTIAWAAMSVEMLRLTGRCDVADELEMTTLNSGLGMHSPSGKWSTYHTPMDGVREASQHTIVFQARAGQPDLNCCSVNAARSLGLVSDWALMQDAKGFVLNWYGPGKIRTRSAALGKFGLNINSGYPFDGAVQIRVKSSASEAFTLKLRIPGWSANTSVSVNGKALTGVKAGSYLAITRQWNTGDVIALQLDLSLHAWVGERECGGRTSLYRGPILLTWDRRYNLTDPAQLPELDAAKLVLQPATWSGWLPPALLLETVTVDGTPLRLCDFASAGNGGTPYISWLKVRNATKLRRSAFTPDAAVLAHATLTRAEQVYTEFQAAEAKDAPTALRLLMDLRSRLPHLQEAVKALSSAKRQGASASLKTVLARLTKTTPLLSPQLAEKLNAMEDALYAAHPGFPRKISTFAVSALQPHVADIAKAPPPAAKLAFQPVRSITGEGFADVREAHGGADGLLYIRASYHSARAGAGELRIGSDGPTRVWVNGKPVACLPNATNPAVADAFRTPVSWRAGNNAILLAFSSNQGRAWGTFLSACAVPK